MPRSAAKVRGKSHEPGLAAEGPDVGLPRKAAESLGLAVHELTTNAVKHGVLKIHGGGLDVRWTLGPDPGGVRRLDRTWAETGVPSPAPSRQGFGSELITQAFPYRLGAETELAFRRDGGRRTIGVPLPEADAAFAQDRAQSPRARPQGVPTMSGPLTGKRILIVEDKYFIAFDLKRALEAEQAVVVGPVGEVDRGLSLAADGPLDAAVLDVNLEGATSFAIADELSEQGVSYMFLTGHDAWVIPDAYRAVPRMLKPFQHQAVVACLSQLVDARAR